MKKGNTTLPPFLVEAWDNVCPFCHRPPTVEHLGDKRFQLKCPDYECPVMPSALPASTLEDACRDWSARVQLVNTGALLTLQSGAPIPIDEATGAALSDAFHGMRVPRANDASGGKSS